VLLKRDESVHRRVFVQLHSPLLVLCGAPSELSAKVRKNLDMRQEPKSFSRIAVKFEL
jgi:hypothetical protein